MRAKRRGGFTLIELMIVIAILAIIMAIAIPNLLQARKAANETNAVGALKTLTTAEGFFRDGDKDNDVNIDYGMLSELSNAELIDNVLGSGTKSGYIFAAAYSLTSSEFLWFGTANPALAGQTGDRYFCVGQAGVIYYTNGGRIALDVDTCKLPNGGVVVVGK
jgi:prepilin-type N-terminal cleavage/methylation domain-containing protein